jgi:hypothetical protein
MVSDKDIVSYFEFFLIGMCGFISNSSTWQTYLPYDEFSHATINSYDVGKNASQKEVGEVPGGVDWGDDPEALIFKNYPKNTITKARIAKIRNNTNQDDLYYKRWAVSKDRRDHHKFYKNVRPAICSYDVTECMLKHAVAKLNGMFE